jgi:hypothetical protein
MGSSGADDAYFAALRKQAMRHYHFTTTYHELVVTGASPAQAAFARRSPFYRNVRYSTFFSLRYCTEFAEHASDALLTSILDSSC